MTENIYRPTLWIDGELLDSGRAYAGEAVLDRLKIKWGAKDWYELVDAATLTVVVRTFTPGFGAGLAERQARVLLTRAPDDRVVFRGRVIKVRSNQVTARSKAGTPMRRYEHTLTVADPLDELARDRRRGMVRNLEEPNSHWGPCTMQERRLDLMRRIEQTVILPPNALDEYNDINNGQYVYMWPVTPYEMSQTVSTLTVLRNTLRIRNALARPVYRAAHDDIVPIHPPRTEAGGFTVISVDGFHAFIDLESGIDVKLPGELLSMPEGVGSETTARELVTDVEIMFRTCKPNQTVRSSNHPQGTTQRWEWNEEPNVFGLNAKAKAKMTVQLDCDDSPGYFYGTALMSYGLPIFEALNFYGAQQVRPLRYTFDKTAPAPAWALEWLDPFPPIRKGTDWGGNFVPKVYRLSGSQTNAWPRAEAFCIVGGELEYSHAKGWAATVFPAVAGRRDRPKALKLGDLANDPSIGGTKLGLMFGPLGDYAQAKSIDAGRTMKVSKRNAN